MTLPISTLDRQYGFGNLATLADAVISRLIGLGHLDESNPRLVAAYQEIAFNRLGIIANRFTLMFTTLSRLPMNSLTRNLMTLPETSLCSILVLSLSFRSDRNWL